MRYLGRNGIRWPDQLRGPWRITFHWAEINGRAECVGVDMRSFRSDNDDESLRNVRPLRRGGEIEAVTASRIREVNWGSEIDDMRKSQAAVAASLTAEDKAELRRLAEEQLRIFTAAAAPKGGRPRQYGVDHYVEVMLVYGKAKSKPRQAVAQHFGVSESTAAKWISTARNDLKLLPATTKGRSSGVGQPDKSKARKR